MSQDKRNSRTEGVANHALGQAGQPEKPSRDTLARLLRESAAGLGVALTAETAAQFLTYQDLLLDWNTRMNLTAITEPREVVLKHFADCLALLTAVDAAGKTVIDVGTGAGFPGLPLKLACPSAQVTLVDALQKRLDFLAAVQAALGLSGLALLHGRAEDLGHDQSLREGFDLCVSRAVADLPVLLEFCLPFVKVGGRLAALKGPALPQELERSQKALSLLGGRVVLAQETTIPGTELHHHLLVVEKIAPTPKA